jgi:outer membrane murein-binding lipoprotein Lpp
MTKGTTMKPIIAAAVLATLAVSGCASLPDSIKGPFASHKQSSVSDAGVQQPEVSPFPQETDEGKF